MRTKQIITAILLAFLIFSIISPIVSAQAMPHYVVGTITVDGIATSGVSVSCDGKTTTTNSTGGYRINTESGKSLKVVATYNGHSASSGTFTTKVEPPYTVINLNIDTTYTPPSGGGTTSPPSNQFIPYVMPLNSSDGSVIGNLTGKSYTSVLLWADKNFTINGSVIRVTLEGELNAKPEDTCWLDINLQDGEKGLPESLFSAEKLLSINLTSFNSKGWGWRADKTKIAVYVPEGSIQSDKVFLVQFVGNNYSINVPVKSGPANGTVKYTATIYGDNGVYTLITEYVPTPTPTPVPTPTPTPTPTPKPPSMVDSMVGGIPFILGALVIGLVVGAGVMIGIYRMSSLGKKK